MRAFSGSFFNSCLICLVHCAMAVSSDVALSFEEIVYEAAMSEGGTGNMVLPLTWPMVT